MTLWSQYTVFWLGLPPLSMFLMAIPTVLATYIVVFGGMGSFRWGTNTGLLLLPVVTLVEPILGVAMALTLLIQAFVSVRIGIMEARSQRDRGIAGITAGVLALMGAAWGLGVGVLLCLVIYGRRFFQSENDGTFAQRD